MWVDFVVGFPSRRAPRVFSSGFSGFRPSTVQILIHRSVVLKFVHNVIYLHTRDSYSWINVTIFIRFPVKQAEIFGDQCVMFTCTFSLTRLGWNYTFHCFTSQVAVEISRGLHSHGFHYIYSTIVTD